ncbi:HAD family hydrolase [Clostridium sp. LP20]|uniref:HAD family hydrolase n=1 Tax=Clostridium sp. LP20 TaxID=3418665 RepID=UPI003EE7DF39
MLKDIKAAIFDLDGTLIDSMWIWEKIDVDFLKDKGFDMPKNLKDEINHLSFQETAHYFKNRFNLTDSIDSILDTWHNMALKHYTESVTLKDGALELLQYLKKSGIKIGLATSNSTPLLEAGLRCVGIYDYFDAITTTDEAKKGKNNPDVYLLAANKLDTIPRECIVFEDILEAVKGAKLANMKIVAIYDKFAEYQNAELINIADKYILNFHEIL